MPKISVIVPVYNTSKYLRKCLDSILGQSFEEFELIIINDGSKDESDSIINEYINRYKDKIIYINQENSGQANARNNAIKKSTGDYICFVDSDDYIKQDMFETMYNKALEDDSDIVVCDAVLVYDDGKEVVINGMKKFSSDLLKDYIISSAGPCYKLIKREIIVNNNLYFKEGIIYEDLAVVPSYAIFAKAISYVSIPFYMYYQRSGSSMNQTNYSQKLENIFTSYDNLINIFKKNNAFDKYIKELEYLYIEHMLRAASFRFLAYDRIDLVKKIIEKNEFGNKIFKNDYFKRYTFKERSLAKLIYNKKFKTINLLCDFKRK